jgi:dynein heavy chain 1
MWVIDFVNRIKNLKEIIEHAETHSHFNGCKVWLGGLLYPEAFLTATRQFTSHKNSVPLDLLSLYMKVGLTTEELEIRNEPSFIITGLHVECAELAGDKFIPSDALLNPLPPIIFTWVCENNNSFIIQEKEKQIVLPLYLNNSRDELLCSVFVKKDSSIPDLKYYQRGASLAAWSS